MQLASCQHGLQHISRIHGALGLSGSHDGVKLIDEQNDLPFALLYFLQYGFQTLLKLAPVLRACHQGTHIQGEKFLVLQSFGNIAPDNSLRQAFHHGCFTYAGFTNQDRVVLGLSGKNPHHVPNLAVTADDRVQLLVSGPLHQVVAVLVQRVVGRFRVVADHPLVSSDRRQSLKETLPGNTIHFKQVLHGLVWVL